MPNNDVKLRWFVTKVENGRTLVFDPIRKIYCALTPEEKVRQETLYMLVEQLNVPAGLIAVEYSIKVNNLDKRCDAVIFNTMREPLMIVECKANSVKLSEKTLDQAIRYFSALGPRYILLTNGLTCHCFQIHDNTISHLNQIPDYETMTTS